MNSSPLLISHLSSLSNPPRVSSISYSLTWPNQVSTTLSEELPFLTRMWSSLRRWIYFSLFFLFWTLFKMREKNFSSFRFRVAVHVSPSWNTRLSHDFFFSIKIPTLFRLESRGPIKFVNVSVADLTCGSLFPAYIEYLEPLWSWSRTRVCIDFSSHY